MQPPSPPRPDPLIGRTLGGKYVVEACLGLGGFGAVYRARQIPVNRAVAVKVAHQGVDPLGPTRDRFLREATALAGLQNRAVAMLHDFGEEPDGLLYMVQEFVDGRDLAAILSEAGRLPALRVVDLGASVLEALIEAHGLGIVHRDIKPANIMLVPTRRGAEQVKLVDFGLAKAPMGGGRIATITGDDLIPGTPPYMAPEIWNQAPLTGAVDQYALAVVLYRALAGRLPFDHPRLGGLMQQHLASPVPAFDPDLRVPPALAAVVHRALAKRPEDRFPDASAMRQALLHALPDETVPLDAADRAAVSALLAELHRPTPVLPAALDPPTAPGRRRRPWRVWAALTLALAAVVGAAAAAWWAHHATPDPEPAPPRAVELPWEPPP
ncbi:MAG: serine/threonine protein kinase [Myxococcales bacterium]|nr:serine/threonine protein kinase [Myxococcales bacterium]